MSDLKIKWKSERAISSQFIELENLKNDEHYQPSAIKLNNIFNEAKEQLWNKIISSFINFHKFNDFFSIKKIDQDFSELYSKNKINSHLDTNQLAIDIIDLSKKLDSEKEQEHIFIFRVTNLKTEEPRVYGNITIADATQKIEETSIAETTLNFLDEVNLSKCKNYFFRYYIQPTTWAFSKNYILNDVKNKIKINKIRRDELVTKLNKTLNGTVIQVLAKGDEEFSKKKALKDASSLLNEILFFSHLSLYYKALPSLETDKYTTSNFIKIDTHNSRITFGAVDPTLIYSVNLSHHKDEFMNKQIQHLEHNLSKTGFPFFQKTTQIHKRIATAIDWYSNALKENNLHIAFLFYCIGLEALFSINQSTPITENLSDNCALLLGLSIDKRIEIKREVKKLYQQRSGIAHGSKTNILEKDLNSASMYLKYSIINFIDLLQVKNITTDTDILNYFEQKKFDSSEFDIK